MYVGVITSTRVRTDQNRPVGLSCLETLGACWPQRGLFGMSPASTIRERAFCFELRIVSIVGNRNISRIAHSILEMISYAIWFGLVLLVVTIGLELFRRGRLLVTPPAKPTTDSETSPWTFDSVRPAVGFDVDARPPHPYAPWSGGKFQMTMGIRRMQEDSWLR